MGVFLMLLHSWPLALPHLVPHLLILPLHQICQRSTSLPAHDWGSKAPRPPFDTPLHKFYFYRQWQDIPRLSNTRRDSIARPSERPSGVWSGIVAMEVRQLSRQATDMAGQETPIFPHCKYNITEEKYEGNATSCCERKTTHVAISCSLCLSRSVFLPSLTNPSFRPQGIHPSFHERKEIKQKTPQALIPSRSPFFLVLRCVAWWMFRRRQR